MIQLLKERFWMSYFERLGSSGLSSQAPKLNPTESYREVHAYVPKHGKV